MASNEHTHTHKRYSICSSRRTVWWHLSILTSSTINAVIRLTNLSPRNSKRSLLSADSRMQLVACARSALLRVGISRPRGLLEASERWPWRLDRPVAAVDGAMCVSRRSGRYTFDRFRPIKSQRRGGSTTNEFQETQVTGLCSKVGCSYGTFYLGLLYCSIMVEIRVECMSDDNMGLDPWSGSAKRGRFLQCESRCPGMEMFNNVRQQLNNLRRRHQWVS